MSKGYTHTSEQIHARWGDIEPGTAEDGNNVAISGRIMFRNRMGHAMFVRLHDQCGQIQVYIREDEVGAEIFEMCRGLEIGDFLWVRGDVMKTRTGGVLSIKAKEAKLDSN